MIDRRPFENLGHANHGWLNARHHFSFANWYDPARMGWGDIRVWNDDEIGARSGFPPHGHADMEIITYVRTGAITHKDSMGNEGRTGAGDVQVMSAGTGVQHAEYNLEDETTTLFQIWIMPRARGGAPGWGAKPFPKDDRSGKFVVLASGFDEDAEALQDPRRRAPGRGDPDRRRNGGLGAGRRASCLSGRLARRGRGQWRQAERARRRGDQG
jgi:quercetin 2,3-dioxygenase